VFDVKHICLRVTSCVCEVKHSSLMFSTVIIILHQESEVTDPIKHEGVLVWLM
jgi:hypothetical protein